MKKILLGITLIASFAACKQTKTELDNKTREYVLDSIKKYNNSIETDKAAARFNADKTRQQKTSTSETRSYSAANAASTAQAPVATKKKGWSHRARGAAVGAGAGAVTGAIVNKNNRAAGALIGGAIGAASGYIIGNEVDKKKP